MKQTHIKYPQIQKALDWVVPYLILWRDALQRWFTSSQARYLVFAVVVGMVAGLTAYIFHALINFLSGMMMGQNLSFKDLSWPQKALRVLFPALGGLGAGFLMKYLAKSDREQGVPDVIHSLIRRGGRMKAFATFIKSLAAGSTLGSGGSAGPEGPVAEIGGATGSLLGKFFSVPPPIMRMLVAGGAAGGIAASFMAPIGGVFFALEIMLAEFTPQAFSLVVLSSVTATVVSRGLLGETVYFSAPLYSVGSNWELFLFALLGILAGLVAKVYVMMLDGMEDLFSKLKKYAEWARPALGGLVVGGIALIAPQVLGTGHTFIEQALWGQLAFSVLLTLVIAKILATSITLGSGGIGGVFLPGFYVGAMLGGAYGIFVKDVLAHVGISGIAPPGAFALVGMAALLAGATRAPMTAFIMIFEITDEAHMILPVMVATVLATMVSRSIESKTIYTRKLAQRGIREETPQPIKPLEIKTVEEVMTRNVVSISPSLSLEKLARMVETRGHSGFPVVDSSKKLVGLVTFDELRMALNEEDLFKAVIVAGDIMRIPSPTVFRDQPLSEALQLFSDLGVDRLPVVSREHPQWLLGVVTQHDIIGVYSKLIKDLD
jgi:CIC family chloride channel protein